jgi:hypothetical protein
MALVEFRGGWPPGWALLWGRREYRARGAGPVVGRRGMCERDELASAAVGGGAKHVHGKRVAEFRDGWPPAWPLLALTFGSCDCECCDGSFHLPSPTGAKTRIQNPDFRLRHGGCIATGTEGGVEAIVWFGFRVLGCRSTAKGAPWASFRSLSG